MCRGSVAFGKKPNTKAQSMTQVRFTFQDKQGHLQKHREFTLKVKRAAYDIEDVDIDLPEELIVLTDNNGEAIVNLVPLKAPYHIYVEGDDDSASAALNWQFCVPDSTVIINAKRLYLAPPPRHIPWDEDVIDELAQIMTDVQQHEDNASAAPAETERNHAVDARDTSEVFAMQGLNLLQENQAIDADTLAADLKNNTDATKGTALIGTRLAVATAIGRTLQEKIYDFISVKDFGAKGDGITDDSPAFREAIKYLCGDNPGGVNLQGLGALWIPSGQYLIKSQVIYTEATSRKINLAIFGAGSHQTTILVDKDNHDGFLRVGVIGGNEAIFNIRDFTIIANGDNNGTALNLFADPVGLSRNRRFLIQNVSVRPNAADGQWFNRAFVINGMYYGLVDNCSASGPFGSTVSTTSYQDTSPAYFMDVAYDLTDCYDVTVQNCFAWSCKVAYDLSNTLNPGSEGGFLFHSGASRVLTGVKRHTVGREPGFIAAYCHFNYRDSGMDLMNLKDVDIKTCMIYNENDDQIGSGPSPVDIRMQGCQDVTINSCRYQFTGDRRRIGITIADSFGNTEGRQEHRALNYMIDNNDFATTNMKYGVVVYSVSDSSLNRTVLKSFQGNQWIDSAVGDTMTAILYMPNGGDPVGWTRTINGITGFYNTAGERKLAVTPTGHIINESAPFYEPVENLLQIWRRSRADIIQSLTRGRVLFLGDSNMIGVGAISAAAPYPRKYSFPAILVRRLNDLNAVDAGPFGTGGFSAGNYHLTDPRVAVSSGWTYTVETVGGGLWENSTNTQGIQFSPGFQWDTAEVWFACGAAATCTFGPVGTPTSFSIAGGAVEKKTLTLTSLTSANLHLQRTTGTVRVMGFACYDSSKVGVTLHNAGRSGWRCDQAADDTSFYSPLSAATAVEPDLTVIQFGLNDWNQNINPTIFKENLEKIILSMRAAGSDILLMVPFQPTASGKAYTWSLYRSVIKSLAAKYALPVCDITALLGSPPDATWLRDALHLNSKGYADVALLVEKALRY